MIYLFLCLNCIVLITTTEYWFSPWNAISTWHPWHCTLLVLSPLWFLLCCLWCKLRLLCLPLKSWCSLELSQSLSFQSAHSSWALLSIPKASTLSKMHWQLWNASLWLKVLCGALDIFPKCLSTWMFHNHLKFKMSNIHYLFHVIHPKLSFVAISLMPSHDQHCHLPSRPSSHTLHHCFLVNKLVMPISTMSSLLPFDNVPILTVKPCFELPSSFSWITSVALTLFSKSCTLLLIRSS